MIKTGFQTGRDNPNYGKGAYWQRNNKPHPMLGKNHSTQSREKISVSNRGKEAWNKGMYMEDNLQWKGSRASYYNEAHRVWESYWRELVPSGYVLHHLDEDYKNNDITNLTVMEKSKHILLHNKTRRNDNY